jgi:hypothetical protein
LALSAFKSATVSGPLLVATAREAVLPPAPPPERDIVGPQPSPGSAADEVAPFLAIR